MHGSSFCWFNILYKTGEKPDWKMEKLAKIYNDINLVNMNFSKKLSDIKINDAILNAIAKLGFFAENINIMISKDRLAEIEDLFQPYFLP